MSKRAVLALLAVVVALAASLPGVAGAAAKPEPDKRLADLVGKSVTWTYAGGQLSVQVKLKNKGVKKAKASSTGIFLTPAGAGTPVNLGTLPAPKIKPKKSATVTGTLTVPASAAPGSYTVLACADSAFALKEGKEQNNCVNGAGVLTIAAPPKVTISWEVSSETQGTIAGTTTSGACTPAAVTGSCTATVGAGSVTLTATATLGFRFINWTDATGKTCGSGGETGNVLTITNATTDRGCRANFTVDV